MAWAKIPMYTFYKYFDRKNDDLFEGVRDVIETIPNNSHLDADVLIENLILEAGEFPVLYADPEFYKRAVTNWAHKQAWAWNKYVKALNVKYEPLENYDRIEEWQDNGEHADKGTAVQTNTQSSHSDVSGDVTDKISGYNVDSFRNSDRSETTTQSDIDSTGTANNHTESDGTTKNVHTGRVHGNIGVTTSQQMLMSEIELADWNIYNVITTSFISELCLALYV